MRFRVDPEHRYVSPEIGEEHREDVATASEMCPTQAIELLD